MLSHRPYQICRRCVMDTSDPAIRFDRDGICNHCTGYLLRATRIIYQGQASDRRLSELVEKVRSSGRGKPYDCLIGVSGGVDSSYLVYLVARWKLRPLLVHMDNGWNSEKAVINIQRICSAFEFDYKSYVLNWEEFRQIQLAFLKASIVEAEMPTDVAIQGALHRVAAEYGINFILSGGNLATEGILPRSWFYYPKDSRLLHSICRQFNVTLKKSFPTFDVPTELYYKYIRRIRILYPLNFVDYSKQLGQQTLTEHCDWIDYGGKHHESRFTKFVQSYLHPVKFGVDYRRSTLSTQICLNQVTRDRALEILAGPAFDERTLPADKAYVAKKLGIESSELERILQAAPKTYRDYPNNELLLRLVYAIYRKFFGNHYSYDASDER